MTQQLAYALAPEFDHSELFGFLRDLEHGLLDHTKWLKTLHRALICHLPPDPADLDEHAHCLCRFGQWYHSNPSPGLHAYPDFATIGDMHKTMHDEARALLTGLVNGKSVDATAYDAFMDQAIEFKFRVHTLQFSLINEFCAIDPLTGVCNRHGMLFKLRQEQERSMRTGQMHSVCMLDFDHFKQVNDQHGHLAGDEVLRQAVGFLKTTLRPYDMVFRYGGEEFLVCLPNTGTLEAKTILERVRVGFEMLTIPLAGNGATLGITASFGIAGCNDTASVEEIIARADHALFAAKKGGRNQVVVWQ